MTDSNRSTNEVPALLEERRKFETWIAALDARRESTPQHVFERVKEDYTRRMRQVEERLAAHRHSIQEERTSLESRRSLLEAEEQLRRDERAELELRAHVGELTGADSDAAFKAVDEALAHMTSEREVLDRRIAELAALLDDRVMARTPVAAQPVQPAQPEQSAPAESAPESKPSVPAAPASPEPAAASSSSEEELRVPRSPRRPGSGSFDELAFLSEVVGEKTEAPVDRGPSDREVKPAIIRDEPVSESLLSGLGTNRGEPPLAANVPANTPIALRSSGAIEQPKTLKCNECGAMNYPTEWYCERCGAELAAL